MELLYLSIRGICIDYLYTAPKFLSPELFSWMTRSKRTLDSGEVRKILSQHESGLSIPLFIKKHDDEGADFYYIGQAEYIKGRERQTTIKDEEGRDGQA